MRFRSIDSVGLRRLPEVRASHPNFPYTNPLSRSCCSGNRLPLGLPARGDAQVLACGACENSSPTVPENRYRLSHRFPKPVRFVAEAIVRSAIP